MTNKVDIDAMCKQLVDDLYASTPTAVTGGISDEHIGIIKMYLQSAYGLGKQVKERELLSEGGDRVDDVYGF